jgi:hypothetical protein
MVFVIPRWAGPFLSLKPIIRRRASPRMTTRQEHSSPAGTVIRP